METPLLKQTSRIRALVAAAEAEACKWISAAGRIYTDSIRARSRSRADALSQGVIAEPDASLPWRSLPSATPPGDQFFVHENLHEDVSLMQMAEEAKLEPGILLYKCSIQSTGVAPHANLFLRAHGWSGPGSCW